MSIKTPKDLEKSDLSYNDYLKVPELLELQIPQSEPAHHDEHLFIVIHQAYELWFKQIHHELDQVVVALKNQNELHALHFMNRIVEILKLLVSQIHILETMAPVDFLQFRDRLNPASGFQSLQFRELEFRAGIKDEQYLKFFKDRPEMLAQLEKRLKENDLRHDFYEFLRQKGFSIPENASKLELQGNKECEEKVIQAILPIFQNPKDHLALNLLAESLVSFDLQMGLWREHHVRVVQRVIGFKIGTGGSSGVEYLKSTTHKQAFPLLVTLRTRLLK